MPTTEYGQGKYESRHALLFCLSGSNETDLSLEPNIPETESEIERLVKAADSICAYIKCLEELAAGNKEFSRAKKTIEEKVHSLRGLPEVDYFMKHFVSGFSMTLDEISEPLEN